MDISLFAGHNSRLSVFPSFEFQEQIVANSPQAKKRARQGEKHRQRNAGQRSQLRTHIKGILNAIGNGDADAANAAYKAAVPVIDAAVNKGLIHKNKAARNKSRLNTGIKALATG